MTRKIKIFGYPSFTNKIRQSGVDYVRISLPLTELNLQKDFETKIHDVNNPEDWEQVAREYDVIYLNYLNNPIEFAKLGCMVKKYKKKMVLDIDDNLWQILPDNPAHKVWNSKSIAIKNLGYIVNEVDYVTCTNQYLKNAIGFNTDKKAKDIFVFPNRIDLDTVYTWRKPFRDEYDVTMVHFGSTTHFHSIQNNDFVSAVDRIMKDYPNVRFQTTGCFIGKFKERWGSRYVVKEGVPDLMTWIKKVRLEALKDTDFMVVPLNNNIYNRAKSSIKFLEASSCKLPGCWQDIRQYRNIVRDGQNGFLCKSTKDWYKKMKKMIDNVELRKRMGEAAFETVKESWQIKDNIKPYIDFFRNIV